MITFKSPKSDLTDTDVPLFSVILVITFVGRLTNIIVPHNLPWF